MSTPDPTPPLKTLADVCGTPKEAWQEHVKQTQAASSFPTPQPTATATPRTIEQTAMECADTVLNWYSSPHKNSESAKLECANLIAATMREVVERELSSAQAALVAAKAELWAFQRDLAEAKRIRGVELNRLRDLVVRIEKDEAELTILRAALAEAKAEVARLKESYLKSQSLAAAMLAKSSDELTALRAELDWLDKHCSFVADEEYHIGPYKIGQLRNMARDGIAIDAAKGTNVHPVQPTQGT